MTRAMTRSVFVSVAAGQTKAICPVVGFASSGIVLDPKTGKPDLAKSTLIVKGSIERANPVSGAIQYLDLDQRWCTLTAQEVATLMGQAAKDGTINRIWMFSSIAGNNVGPGSEPAYLLQLNGSDEAQALAAQYGIAYRVDRVVGRSGIPVVHTNPIVVSMQAASAAGFGLWAPPLEKEEERPGRMDQANPHLLQALKHYDATGELPSRAPSTAQFDTEFAAKFAKPLTPPQGRRRSQAGDLF